MKTSLTRIAIVSSITAVIVSLSFGIATSRQHEIVTNNTSAQALLDNYCHTQRDYELAFALIGDMDMADPYADAALVLTWGIYLNSK